MDESELADANQSPALIQWRKHHLGDATPAELSNSNRGRLYIAREASVSELKDRDALYETEIFISVRLPPELKPRTGARLGGLAHLLFGRKFKQAGEKPAVQMNAELSNAVGALQLGLNSAGFETASMSGEEQSRFFFDFSIRQDRRRPR